MKPLSLDTTYFRLTFAIAVIVDVRINKWIVLRSGIGFVPLLSCNRYLYGGKGKRDWLMQNSTDLSPFRAS